MRTSIWVVTPKGWQPPDWGWVHGAISAAAFCNGQEDRPRLAFAEPLPGKYIQDERNIRTHQFLLSEATHLGFVDSDICWHVDHLLELLATGKDAVGATHRHKDGSGQIVGVTDTDAREAQTLIPAEHLAAGFMLLSRRAVKLACAHEDVPRYDVPGIGFVDGIWNTIHRPDAQPPIYLRDDYAFCLRAREMGVELWRHTGVVVGHAGRAVY